MSINDLAHGAMLADVCNHTPPICLGDVKKKNKKNLRSANFKSAFSHLPLVVTCLSHVHQVLIFWLDIPISLFPTCAANTHILYCSANAQQSFLSVRSSVRGPTSWFVWHDKT